MAKPAPVIDPRTSLLTVEQNGAFSYQPVATGTPTLWTATGLPSGLSINAGTGAITGTPTVAGVFGVLLTANNYETRTVTVDNATEIFTANGHAFVDGDALTHTSSGTLPAPMVSGDTYYVRDIVGATYKLSATPGGAVFAVTTNGTGTHTASKRQSDELALIIPVLATGSTIGAGEMTVEIDVDVVTGRVSIVGIDDDYEFGPPTTEKRDDGYKRAVLLVKEGDIFPAAIGFTRNGVLQDLGLTGLDIGGVEFRGDQSLGLSDGTFTKTGIGSTTRYKVDLYMRASTWSGVLSNNADDLGTYLDAQTEIQYKVLSTDNSYDESIAQAIATLQGNADTDKVHDFTLIPEITEATDYTISATLTNTGNANQDVSLVNIVAPVTWTGSAFTIGTLEGTTTGQGISSGAGKWQSTLTVESVTGDANSVTVNTNVTTTAGAYYTGVIPFSAFVISDGALDDGIGGAGSNETIEFRNVSDTKIGTTITMVHGDTAASLKTKMDTALGNSDVIELVFSNAADTATVRLLSTTTVRKVWSDATISDVTLTSKPNGDANAATITVAIVGSGEDDVYRKTSETFILRAEQDVVAD